MKAVTNRPVVVDAVVVDGDARNPHQDFSLCPSLPHALHHSWMLWAEVTVIQRQCTAVLWCGALQLPWKRCSPTALDFLLRCRYAVWRWITYLRFGVWNSDKYCGLFDEEEIYIWFEDYCSPALRCHQGMKTFKYSSVIHEVVGTDGEPKEDNLTEKYCMFHNLYTLPVIFKEITWTKYNIFR